MRRGNQVFGVESTRAMIIRLTRLTESSLIVHWFTQNNGLVKTVAKGARKSGSIFAGRLDLFFVGEILFQPARRGEIHALREATITQWREGLRKNYHTTLFAAYCCQLLECAVEPEQPDPELYDLLDRALNHADCDNPDERSVRFYEKELARILGVAQRERDAHLNLQDAIGRLPLVRHELLERLAKKTISTRQTDSSEQNARIV